MSAEGLIKIKEIIKSMLKIDQHNIKTKLMSLFMLIGSFYAISSSNTKDKAVQNTEDISRAAPDSLFKDKIKLYIFPFGSGEMMIGHAALEYRNNVIDYSTKGFSEKLSHHKECYVYEIDPLKVNIDPDKLEEAIKNRKAIIKGSNYNYLTENCADQIFEVLTEAGATDLKKTLGISIPKLDGVPSLDDWAEKHGTLIQTPIQEMGALNLQHYIKSILSNAAPSPNMVKFEDDFEKVENYVKAICNPEQYKNDIKEHYKREYKRACAEGNILDKIKANHEYSEHKMLVLLPQEELARQVAEIFASYPESNYKKMMLGYNQKRIQTAFLNNGLSEKTKELLRSAGFSEEALGSERKILPLDSKEQYFSLFAKYNYFNRKR